MIHVQTVFSRYIIIAQCMRNVFTFYCIQVSWKHCVSEKIKAHLTQHPQALQQLFSPHLFNFIQKFLVSAPFKKDCRDYAFYMRDERTQSRNNKVITIL